MYVYIFKKGRKMEKRSDGLKSGLLKHGQPSLLREKVKHLQYFKKLFEIGRYRSRPQFTLEGAWRIAR
jgi:hypothetical protein